MGLLEGEHFVVLGLDPLGETVSFCQRRRYPEGVCRSISAVGSGDVLVGGGLLGCGVVLPGRLLGR